ncbi:MAG: hypothetical protein PWR04_1417, partial [Anaerophaga sp.]|nr:hypothetical protein [Anaerophaga sp.]
DFFKLLIFSSSPLGVRGKNGKNQQFEGFLYYTHKYFFIRANCSVAGGWGKKLKRKDVCCVYNSHYWLLTTDY